MSGPQARDRRSHSFPNKKLNEADFEATGEVVEPSKTKVNRWVDSESPQSVDTTKEKSHHAPANLAQRTLRGTKTPDALGTRPQTDPGRSRDQSLSEKLKKSGRQTALEIVKSPSVTDTGDTSTEANDTQLDEPRTLVEKLLSDTDVSSKPEVKQNTLFPVSKETPRIGGSPTLRNEKGSDIKMMAPLKKTGSPLSLFSTQPKLISSPKLPEKQTEKIKTPVVSQRGLSIVGMGTFAQAITKFKRKSCDEGKIGFQALPSELQEILKIEHDTMRTEIPEAMMTTIKEEAYKIILKTTQVYRSQVGARHRLTRQAYEYVKELREELYKP